MKTLAQKKSWFLGINIRIRKSATYFIYISNLVGKTTGLNLVNLLSNREALIE